MTVIGGIDDPIAVAAMAERLQQARPPVKLHRLEGVGHYPMVEASTRFAAAVSAAID